MWAIKFRTQQRWAGTWGVLRHVHRPIPVCRASGGGPGLGTCVSRQVCVHPHLQVNTSINGAHSQGSGYLNGDFFCVFLLRNVFTALCPIVLNKWVRREQ